MSTLAKGVEIGSVDTEALAEARFREIADDAAVMMWRADADGRFVWFSRSWLAFVGRPLERELGRGWRGGIHPDDAEPLLTAFDEAVDRREAFSLRYRVRAGDGSWRWIIDKGAPALAGDAFAGYHGSRVDVTELLALRAHQEVLLSELDHRVKNNLQLTIAFLSFSVSRAEGAEARALLTAAIRRVQGIGVVQEPLHRNGGETIDLADYLPRVARSVVGDDAGGAVVMLVDVVTLRSPFPQAASLGLIVSELVSEAARREGAGGEPLVLRLARLGEDRAELTVTGGGPETLRADALVAALARHVKATVTRPSRGGGLVRLIFPIQSPQSALADL